jgi:hypothetical protein
LTEIYIPNFFLDKGPDVHWHGWRKGKIAEVGRLTLEYVKPDMLRDLYSKVMDNNCMLKARGAFLFINCNTGRIKLPFDDSDLEIDRNSLSWPHTTSEARSRVRYLIR